MPPMRNVIGWPNEGVDEVEQVAQYHPENKAGGRQIPILDVKGEGGYIEGDCDDG